MQDLKKLFRDYIEGRCSPDKINFLFEQLDREQNKHLKEELIRGQLAEDADHTHAESGMIKERLDLIFQKILLKIDSPAEGTRKVVFMRSWMVAAVLLLLLASITYIEIGRKPRQTQIAIVKKPVRTDIPAPAIARAVLKLDNGRVLDLDSAGNGSLAVQGGVHIVKTAEGQITYTGAEASTTKYNMLTNPRGSKVVSLTLVDGTRVWLNAESSLHYPTTFNSKERKVEVTGEAYFEVAHNPKRPFVVSKDSLNIQVLGTHFNVNTYDNEAVSKITLLEGLVKVSIKDKRSILAPGQQAQLKGSGIQVVNDINTGEVIAWKNGKFQFSEKTDIGTIMRQLARWYDVDVEFRGNVNQHFWGSIPRDITIAQVLQKIESTGGVKFLIEGNKIIVMP